MKHPAPPRAGAKGAAYNVAVVQRAKEHHASGWSTRRIQDLIEREFGVRPCQQTIIVWVNPKHAERERERWRNARPRNGRRGMAHHGPATRLERMRALAGAGLSCADIARVMLLDYGDDLSRRQVENALDTGRYPRHQRAAA